MSEPDDHRKHASTVVLSHPDELSAWGRDQIEADRYRNYLRKKLQRREEISVGDQLEEFADVGCCGDTLDIAFRVEALEGGETVGPETEVAYVDREEEMAGGWLVQSASAPARE